MIQDVHSDAKCLWDYHHLNQPLEKKSCILAFGSHDTHVAERAADLFHQNLAPYILFTGGLGRLTQHQWHQTEAEQFSEIAVLRGVPKERIFIETASTHTGENISFCQKMIQETPLPFSDFIVVDKPFRERRTYATLKKQWDSLDFIITSPEHSYESYCHYYETSSDWTLHDFISLMVGDFQRMEVYGKRGFQIPQWIPQEAKQAYHRLVKQGFTSQLVFPVLL